MRLTGLAHKKHWIFLALGGIGISLVLTLGLFTYYRAATANSFTSCPTTVSFDKQYRCWESVVKQEITHADTAHALAQLKHLLNTSPLFVKACHSFAHDVGEATYGQFVAGQPMQSSPDTQVCDFGFYHGFMTKFLENSRNYHELGEFCGSIKENNVNGELLSSRWACFHGIGHGSVSEYETLAWANGSRKPLLDTLAICKAAAQTGEDYTRCVEGAYNGMSYGIYKDVLDPKDPYKICREVSGDALPGACYANLASNVFNLTTHRTIQEAIALASTYTPRQYLLLATETFANMASRKLDMTNDFTCMLLPEDQVTPCINGFVSGLVQLESPETKHKGAFELCSSGLLPDTRRVQCYAAALDLLSQFWSPNKVLAACNLAPAQSKVFCIEAQTR